MITFEQVLNAWRNVEPDFKYRDKAVDKNGIRFIFPTQLSIMCGLSETQLNEVVKEKLTRTAYRFGLEQNNKKGGL